MWIYFYLIIIISEFFVLNFMLAVIGARVTLDREEDYEETEK